MIIENQPKVKIVILNWNGAKDTTECVKSLNRIDYKNYEIFLIDNNSCENDTKLLKNLIENDRLTIVFNDINLGFAGGNNVGIKKALENNCEYILLLNNDTIVSPDFLTILLNKFKLDKDIGITAPQINYYSEPDKIWSAGGKISKLRGSGFAVSDRLETEIIKTDKSVEFVSGCCMLIKAEVFNNVELFDEKFFLYVEDTDLCCRVKKAGYKIFVIPQSKIFHKINTTTKKVYSTLPLYYTTRNRMYFAKKNFPLFFFLTGFYISLAMLLKSFIWFIWGEFRNIYTVQMAYKDFFKGRMGKTDHKKLSGG